MYSEEDSLINIKNKKIIRLDAFKEVRENETYQFEKRFRIYSLN